MLDARAIPNGSTELFGRVALVHDFLLDIRGAERVFDVICSAFPEADVFTAVYDEEGTRGRFAHRDVQASFLQRLHPTSRNFRALLPLYPLAIERLDLRGYDLVVSSSSAWAHGVRRSAEAVHVCYCHNPFRYAWDAEHTALPGHAAPVRLALQAAMRRWRDWDRTAAGRVDRYVANSQATRDRISRCFGRSADVVYPPVQLPRATPVTPGDRYLVLSALMRHKRLEVAVEAFNKLGLPLVVVGSGPDERRLRALANANVTFAGRIDDAELSAMLAACKALVVPSCEEFGIAAVEAQLAGRPVIALRAGGVLESIAEGVTGAFFDAQEPDALAAAVRAFDADAIDPADCVENAARFTPERFTAELRDVIAAAVRDVRYSRPHHGQRLDQPWRRHAHAASDVRSR